MVKILKPEEKKTNVVIVGNKDSNSITSKKLPSYFGYNKSVFKK